MMGVEPGMKGKQQGDVHYVNAPPPCVVEESFGAHYHDQDDFALAEVLQNEEYQSIQRNGQIDMAGASSSTNSRPKHAGGQSWEEGKLSETLCAESQLALDEALAKELQEMENQLAGTCVCEISGTEAGKESFAEDGESSSANNSLQVARQDDVDPDDMTYEELQSLGEAIGTQSRGLSEELISFLPTSTYKSGLFSKKEKEECVICCMVYKNRDKLITLPCQHLYHKKCVTRWLKINKACPVCSVEVFGP